MLTVVESERFCGYGCLTVEHDDMKENHSIGENVEGG